jgi:hypothetical protein
MKIRLLCKYEGGKSLSAVSLELGFAISTVNTTVKDAAYVNGRVKGTTMKKSTIILKRHECAVSEME